MMCAGGRTGCWKTTHGNSPNMHRPLGAFMGLAPSNLHQPPTRTTLVVLSVTAPLTSSPQTTSLRKSAQWPFGWREKMLDCFKLSLKLIMCLSCKQSFLSIRKKFTHQAVRKSTLKSYFSFRVQNNAFLLWVSSKTFNIEFYMQRLFRCHYLFLSYRSQVVLQPTFRKTGQENLHFGSW